ncbi:MAG: arabinose transporter permease, partial [Nocardioidaceae bacterium]|nr:arabinose transporter permease [Nocardioidaceae bacterium]
LTGFVLATVLWAVGDVLLLGHPFAVVADLAPEGARARYLAVFGTCWGVAGVVAPLLGGAVLETSGPRVLWLGCAGVAVLLAVAQAPLRSLVTERSGPSRAGRRTPRRRR